MNVLIFFFLCFSLGCASDFQLFSFNVTSKSYPAGYSEFAGSQISSGILVPNHFPKTLPFTSTLKFGVSGENETEGNLSWMVFPEGNSQAYGAINITFAINFQLKTFLYLIPETSTNFFNAKIACSSPAYLDFGLLQSIICFFEVD